MSIEKDRVCPKGAGRISVPHALRAGLRCVFGPFVYFSADEVESDELSVYFWEHILAMLSGRIESVLPESPATICGVE